MNKHFMITLFVVFLFLHAGAQKKNYFSLETGLYFGNANMNLESNMASSGFGDDSHYGFWGINFTDEYPYQKKDKTKYRIRAGHHTGKQTAVEAGFGLTFYGEVYGFDDKSPSPGSNSVKQTNTINTLYIAFIRTNTRRSAGFGAGPAFSFYKITTQFNNQEKFSKNYLLAGGMITGFWNFLSYQRWFAGLRSECSLTTPAKNAEIRITNPYGESRLKETKSGSFNGSITLNAGLRF